MNKHLYNVSFEVFSITYTVFVVLVLWYCWLRNRRGVWPVNNTAISLHSTPVIPTSCFGMSTGLLLLDNLDQLQSVINAAAHLTSMTMSRPCWMVYISSMFPNLSQVIRSGVQLYSWHSTTLPTRCHSACCWSNVVPSIAVCIFFRSYGASNTSFITWRQSLRGCWTTCMEQFISVRHRLLITSHLREISQNSLFQLIFFRARVRLLTVRKVPL